MRNCKGQTVAVLLLAFTSLAALVSCSGKASDVTKEKNVTIRPWQYCEGCKVTADLFSLAVNNHILQLKKSGKTKTVDAISLLDYFCDKGEFSEYQSFIKMSCIKILGEHRIPFVESFQGDATETSMTNKMDSYLRKKHVRN